MIAGENPAPLVPAALPDLERRRAELLLQCAKVVHSHLDLDGVINALAERVQELFSARMVAVLLRRDDRFRLAALATSDTELAAAVHEAHAHEECRFVQEIAQQACAAGSPIVRTVHDGEADVPAFFPAGQVLAAPMRSTDSEGALVVCCGTARELDFHDISLLAGVAGYGALAISNADLYARVSAQARELQQLLDITSELGSIGRLDQFFEKFAVRAADFLGFRRSFIALMEGTACGVRWIAEDGVARPLRAALPEGVAARIIGGTDPFWTNDVSEWPRASEEPFASWNARQCLCLPLMGSNRQLLGVLGVLDSVDGQDVSAEAVRRGRSLAAEIAVVLEAARNVHLSEQHRRRAENLMSVALELNSSLRLPEFTDSFTRRAADMLQARAAAFAIADHGQMEVVVLHEPGRTHIPAWRHRLGVAFADFAAAQTELIVSGPAAKLLGANVAGELGWTNITVARLCSAGGEFVGLLCLADPVPLGDTDRNLLQALVAHAAVGLENARLFTRMDQANRHWMEIFDAITDLIVVHDEQFRVLRVNRSLADFIGVPPSELIGVSMRALVAMASDHSSEFCPFCRGGGGASDEYIHPVLDRTYLVSTSRIHAAAYEGLQTIHVLKDITDRREAERRYRELFDTIQEGLFFSTPEGRFIEVNDALVRMLGYDSREDLLQVDIGSQLYTVADMRADFTSAIERAGVLRNYEESLRRKDGSIIYTLQNAFAVRDAQGQIVQYRGLLLDITELKNFQSELQRQRDFNNKILNNTQSMILVVDTAGLISYANRRCFEAGGYTQEDLLGRKLVELVPPGRREALAEALAETLAGHQVDNLELPILLGQGRGGQFSINLSPMRDEPGNVNSIVVVMTDITDAAMLQAKLMHTEKMAAVGQLVSGVAHELNNPLTAVLGFSDLLLDNAEVPESAKSDLRVVLQEAQRSKQIVQNLLSFARQTPPQRNPVLLNDVIRRTLALRSYDFANHGIQIVEQLQSCPPILADAHQLQQVFLNIINNAYDAVRETGRPGRIEIATACCDGWVEILFRDNGHGIAYPERIFDPFFTTKEVGKGTGLGLSICYGIVREHGGEILCRNNGEAQGATFVVRLPVTEENTKTAAAGGAA
jgi:PAS domain S-box-containing protein